MCKYTEYTGYLDPSKDRAELKDNRGATKTESLFIETISPRSANTYTPLYSLRPDENKGYLSAYQIYMNSVDEHEAALKLVGTMLHWRKLCALKWFMEGRDNTGFEGLTQWREDMRLRDQSLAKRTLIKQTRDGNVTAARALHDLKDGGKMSKKSTKKVTESSETDSFLMEAHQKVTALRKDK